MKYCGYERNTVSAARTQVCASGSMASCMDMTAMAMAAVLCALVILRIIIRI